MALTVCVNSFYLSFVLVFLMTMILDAVAYKYYIEQYKKHLMINFLFYIVIILSLPLMMILTAGACTP